MNKKSKMLSGALYRCDDAELLQMQARCRAKLDEFLQLPSQHSGRVAMLQEMFASFGEGSSIESPFYANWGGCHVHVGKRVYINFNLTMVDDGEIFIGDDTLLAPNVVLTTAGHPINPTLRKQAFQFNLPIHIGKNCWLGSGVMVMPGVTIGDNSVIGAGSIVTQDIPANVVAVGTPCRPLRAISEHDCLFYHKDRPIEPHLLETETKTAGF